MVYKNKDGNSFALLEAIIALGMIAIVGILALQMFMASTNIHAQARDIDKAQSLAMNFLEELRAAREPGELFDTELFSGNYVLGTELFFVMEFGVEFELALYYDANWESVAPIVPGGTEAAFRFELRRTMLGGEFEYDIIGLYDVSIYVWDLRHMEQPILYFYTKLYFPQTGELI